MSEHGSHDDSLLSTLYRRVSREEPPPRLDERILETARRHTPRRSHRWWLPLSTAAMVVLAVSLLLRHQQSPDELQQQIARYEPSPVASVPVPAAAPAAPVPAAPSEEARAAVKPEQKARSYETEAPVADAQLVESAKGMAPPAEAAKAAAAGMVVAPGADAAETKQAEAAASAAVPRAMVEQQRREASVEAPEPWLKRIEAMRLKGENEAARRELMAFRKAYPAWPLPKELLPLLPEGAK